MFKVRNTEAKLRKKIEEGITLSYSQIGTWQGCRQKWAWTYLEDLAPRGKSTPLIIGDIVHRLFDAYYQDKLDIDSIANLNEFAKQLYPEIDEAQLQSDILYAAQLFNGFIQKYRNDELVVTAPEVHIVHEFQDGAFPFKLYTRLDAMAHERDDTRLWRVEHKTAGRMDSSYLKGLRRGMQTGIAHWLMDEVLEERVMGTYYNILVKTKLPQYNRMPVPRDKFQIEATKDCVYAIIRQIKEGDIYCNPSNCFNYNRVCEYHILCTSDSEANRQNFFVKRSEDKKRQDGIVLGKTMQKGGES